MLPRLTEHISRLWTRNKTVRDQPVQVAEVQITSRTLENLEIVLLHCKARHQVAEKHFGAGFEQRKNTMSDEERKLLSKLMPRLQIWPCEEQGQMNLKYFEEKVDLPSSETTSSQNEGGDAVERLRTLFE